MKKKHEYNEKIYIALLPVNCTDLIVNASVTFATGVVQFICLRFSLQFLGIIIRWLVTSYDVCVYIVYDHGVFSFDFFRRQTGTNLKVTLRR